MREQAPRHSLARKFRAMKDGEYIEFPAEKFNAASCAAWRIGKIVGAYFKCRTVEGVVRVTRHNNQTSQYGSLKAALQEMAVGKSIYRPLEKERAVRACAYHYATDWGWGFKVSRTKDEVIVTRVS